MSNSLATATVIGVLSCVFVVLFISFAINHGELQASEARCREDAEAERQQLIDTRTALKAARYLALHGDDVQGYASRGEPDIRLCVPSYGDPRELRVRHCVSGESEVVFPISYLGSNYRPELGSPTVDYRSLNSP